MTVSVGVVGCSSDGIRLANTLKEMEALSFVQDPDKALAKRIGSKLQVSYTDSLEESMKHKCDAVIIASPPRFHAGQIQMAFRKDRDVLVSEPLADDLMNTLKILKLARENETIIMVGATQRFSQANKKLRRLVRNETMRSPLRFSIFQDFRRPARSTPKEDTFLPIQYIDLAKFLTGEDPHRVYASESQVSKEGHSALNLILDYPSGFKAFFNLGSVSRHTRKEILLVGEDYNILRRARRKMISIWKKGKERKIDVREESPLRVMVSEFLDAVRNREVETSSLYDGVNAQLVWEVAEASLNSEQPLPVTYGVIEA